MGKFRLPIVAADMSKAEVIKALVERTHVGGDPEFSALTREKFEFYGFVFGETAKTQGPGMINVCLPEGWKVEETGIFSVRSCFPHLHFDRTLIFEDQQRAGIKIPFLDYDIKNKRRVWRGEAVMVPFSRFDLSVGGHRPEGESYTVIWPQIEDRKLGGAYTLFKGVRAAKSDVEKATAEMEANIGIFVKQYIPDIDNPLLYWDDPRKVKEIIPIVE